jgi:hypothetical protein
VIVAGPQRQTQEDEPRLGPVLRMSADRPVDRPSVLVAASRVTFAPFSTPFPLYLRSASGLWWQSCFVGSDATAYERVNGCGFWLAVSGGRQKLPDLLALLFVELVDARAEFVFGDRPQVVSMVELAGQQRWANTMRSRGGAQIWAAR